MFLIGTIIYYFLPSGVIISTPLNQNFEQQIKVGENHEWRARFARSKSISDNVTIEELQAKYDRRQHTYGKLVTLFYSSVASRTLVTKLTDPEVQSL